jgi:hypothetical protein
MTIATFAGSFVWMWIGERVAKRPSRTRFIQATTGNDEVGRTYHFNFRLLYALFLCSSAVHSDQIRSYNEDFMQEVGRHGAPTRIYGAFE